ncbi:hypothetical protein PG994_013501 [Apiospora phragmitis]|uniref:Uncharacterized protein n=1 Tax=Apiospora phragmitis TaxID=2905665 RepID=A0ABR1T8T2_9PEZI
MFMDFRGSVKFGAPINMALPVAVASQIMEGRVCDVQRRGGMRFPGPWPSCTSSARWTDVMTKPDLGKEEPHHRPLHQHRQYPCPFPSLRNFSSSPGTSVGPSSSALSLSLSGRCLSSSTGLGTSTGTFTFALTSWGSGSICGPRFDASGRECGRGVPAPAPPVPLCALEKALDDEGGHPTNTIFSLGLLS